MLDQNPETGGLGFKSIDPDPVLEGGIHGKEACGSPDIPQDLTRRDLLDPGQKLRFFIVEVEGGRRQMGPAQGQDLKGPTVGLDGGRRRTVQPLH